MELDTMNVNQKGKLIADFYDAFGNDPEFENFFKHNDAGVPLALQSITLRTVSDSRYDTSKLDRFTSNEIDGLIDQTWKDLCHWIGGVDPDGDYATLGNVLKQVHEALETESDVFEAINGRSLLEAFVCGRFGSTPSDVVIELCQSAFELDSEGLQGNSNLRVFIYGWIYEAGLANCSCPNSPGTEHDTRRVKARNELESLIGLDFDENVDEMFRFLLSESLNYDPDFMTLNNQQELHLRTINTGIPLFATNSDGSFRGDFYADDEVLLSELTRIGVSLERYFEVFFNDFASRGDFLNNAGFGFEVGDEVPFEIEEFLLLCEIGAIVEHEFYDWQHLGDFWYPKGLYLMAANRSNKFLSPFPETINVQWNFTKPTPSLPSELIEVFSLIPRIYVLGFCPSLIGIFKDCYSVLIDPMPAIVASRPETSDTKRVDEITSIVADENAGYLQYYDEPLEKEGEDYSGTLEKLSAILHVCDERILQQVVDCQSLLLKYAAFLNPALSEETRMHIRESLDLDFLSENLDDFIRIADTNLDYEFSDLLQSLRAEPSLEDELRASFADSREKSDDSAARVVAQMKKLFTVNEHRFVEVIEDLIDECISKDFGYMISHSLLELIAEDSEFVGTYFAVLSGADLIDPSVMPAVKKMQVYPFAGDGSDDFNRTKCPAASVVLSPSVNSDLLEELAKSGDYELQYRIALNPIANEQTLLTLVRNSLQNEQDSDLIWNEFILGTVALHRNSTDKVIKALTESSFESTNQAIGLRLKATSALCKVDNTDCAALSSKAIFGSSLLWWELTSMSWAIPGITCVQGVGCRLGIGDNT